MKTPLRTALKICLCFSLLLACVVGVCRTAYAEKTAATAHQIDALATAMEDRTQKLQAATNLDRQQLIEYVKSLRAELGGEKDRLARNAQELKTLRAKHAALLEQYDKAAADMRSVEDAVRNEAARTMDLLKQSATTATNPTRAAYAETLTRSREYPGLPAITRLGSALLDEIRDSETISMDKGEYLGPRGALRQGRLLRAGSLFLAGQPDSGDASLLKPGTTPPEAVASTPGEAQAAITRWADGTGDTLPIDPSRGAALSLLESRRTLDDWVQAGGMLLWPILGVGVLALLLILYKSVVLYRLRVCKADFSGRLHTTFTESGWKGTQQLLQSMPSFPAARVLLGATPDSNADLLDKQLQEGFLFELRKQENLLGFIAVLAAIAPLLGLLGTVTGMIDSFQAVTVFGSSNARVMSSGISEALITTQAGLGVAIPVMLMHHFLKQRVLVLTGDMEQQCAALTTLLAGNDSSRKGEP